MMCRILLSLPYSHQLEGIRASFKKVMDGKIILSKLNTHL